VVREGIIKILSEAFPNASINGCADYAQTFDYLSRKKYEIVVLEIQLNGRSGLEILTDVKSRYPYTSVIILSVFREEQFAVRAIRGGALAYIFKNASPIDLIYAIKAALRGEMYITNNVAQLLAKEVRVAVKKPLHELLSDREYWIFKLIASGKSVTEIARELSLSIKTISAHKVSILRKMNFKNNADIMKYAYKYKLIDSDIEY